MITKEEIEKISKIFLDDFLTGKGDDDLILISPENMDYQVIEFTYAIEKEIQRVLDEKILTAVGKIKLSPKAKWWADDDPIRADE